MAKATRIPSSMLDAGAVMMSPPIAEPEPAQPAQAPDKSRPLAEWTDDQLEARLAAIAMPFADTQRISEQIAKRRDALAAHVKAEEHAIGNLRTEMRAAQKRGSWLAEEARRIGLEQARRGAVSDRSARLAAEDAKVKAARAAKAAKFAA